MKLIEPDTAVVSTQTKDVADSFLDEVRAVQHNEGLPTGSKINSDSAGLAAEVTVRSCPAAGADSTEVAELHDAGADGQPHIARLVWCSFSPQFMFR